MDCLFVCLFVGDVGILGYCIECRRKKKWEREAMYDGLRFTLHGHNNEMMSYFCYGLLTFQALML